MTGENLHRMKAIETSIEIMENHVRILQGDKENEHSINGISNQISILRHKLSNFFRSQL